MSERLNQLLRDEADRLDIPHPRLDRIVLDGRRERRRSHLAPAVAVAAAAAAVVVGGVLVLPSLDSDARSGDGSVAVHDRSGSTFAGAEAAAAADAYVRGGAFAAGSKVYIGSSDDYAVQIGDPAVRGLYYTSAGVLVRHGKDYAMDGSSRDSYSLVGTDGSVTGLDLHIGDVSPSTDPALPYFAFAQPGAGDGDWDVVVLDLRSGRPAATVPVDGDFTWGGWEAPPVALSGDRVYVGLDDATVAVEWHTGEVDATPLPSSRYPDINADRYLQIENGISEDGMELDASVRVRDALSGRTLLDLPNVGDRFASLSPDGEHVLVLPYMMIGDDGEIQRLSDAVLYTVDTGRKMELPTSPSGGYGWTPDGLIFSVTGDAVTVCDADQVGCSTTPLDLGLTEGDLGTLRLGGMVNES
jgi:hypothetical protein